MIFVLAYVLRLVYIIEISDRPYFSAPAVDAEYHDTWAQQIAGGDFTFEEGPFFRAPLYPFFLGLLYFLTGHDYFILRVIQALIGALSCVLIFNLGRRLFSERAGLIAGLISACAGIFIYFEAEFLIPVILLPLDLAVILTLLKARDRDRSVWWWLGGIFFGLSAVARPNILITLPVIAVLIITKKQLKRSAVRALLVSLGIILPIIPVTVYNLQQGEFVPISTQGGVNFYIGNNAESDGATAVFPGLSNIWRYEDAVELAETESGRDLSAGEVSDFYYRKGADFIFNQPLKWLNLIGRKTLLWFSRIEISNNKNIYFSARDSILLQITMYNGFWLYGSLGILGFAIFYRRKFEYRIIVWFVLLYSASVILFFVTSRYRAPMLPFFIIFAAAAADYIFDLFKRKDYPALKRLIPLYLPLLLLTSVNFLGVQKIARPYAHFSLGNAYQKKAQPALAEQEYLKALQADPGYKQVNLNLGVIYYDNEEFEKAERHFLREIQLNQGFEAAFAYNNIGNIRVRQGLLEDALYFYRKSLQIYPKYEDGRVNLGRTCHDLGIIKISQDSLQTALKYFAEAVEYTPDEPMFRYNYGLVLGETGREAEAVGQMEIALRINPGFQPAQDVIDAFLAQPADSTENY